MERKARGAQVIAKPRSHPGLADRKPLPLLLAASIASLQKNPHERRCWKEGTMASPRRAGLAPWGAGCAQGSRRPRGSPGVHLPTTPPRPLLRVCPGALSQRAENPANAVCPSTPPGLRKHLLKLRGPQNTSSPLHVPCSAQSAPAEAAGEARGTGGRAGSAHGKIVGISPSSEQYPRREGFSAFLSNTGRAFNVRDPP